MKKRAYMQGKTMPPKRKPKRKHYFNHEFRHTIKKQVIDGLNSAFEHQLLYGHRTYQYPDSWSQVQIEKMGLNALYE